MSSMNLYVGNLSYNTSDADLKDLFGGYGEITSARVITDQYSGQSKGFGFVEMANRGEGEKAIAELNGKDIGGRNIVVNEAKPRAGGERGGGGKFGGGGGRGRGGSGGGGGGGRRY